MLLVYCFGGGFELIPRHTTVFSVFFFSYFRPFAGQDKEMEMHVGGGGVRII